MAFAKLYDRKIALVAADTPNDRFITFYDIYGIPLMRILTDRGTEYCGAREHNEYQLYLAIEDIDHSRIKARSPQTNGICERFHRTMQDEFYATAFRKKIYGSIEELQADVDVWLDYHNMNRPHSGKYCYGKTPLQTWHDSLHLTFKKSVSTHCQDDATLQVSDKTEAGSGGGQPARDSLTDWDGQLGIQPPQFPVTIPKAEAKKNALPDRAKRNPLSDQAVAIKQL